MAKKQKQKTFRWQAYKPLFAAVFAAAGFFHMMGAVVAAGTAAGTDITNTATATYEDEDGNPVNATSNTVTIQVAEIAGITAVPSGFEDNNGGAIEGNDQLEYSFTVTNTGNAETDVFIPGIDNIGSQNFDVTAIEIFAVNPDGTRGASLGTVTPTTGDTYETITGNPLDPDEQFIVAVTGTIADFRDGTTDPVIAGDPIGVTLGNTAPNDNTAGTQNQPLTDDTAPEDLFTIDSDPTLAPENGQREASATTTRPFASADNPLALATVLKTSSVVSNNAANTQDDQITYDLGLRVEADAPVGTTFQAASLEGTEINTVDGNPATAILVSDAIPAGTELESVGLALPAGWSVVYSTDPVAGADPLNTAWVTTAPTNLSTVTRIGFVHAGPLAAGYDTTGLTFTVVTSGLDPAGGTVDNIAQAFGETVGDPDNAVVYDESGDQEPNNFDGSTPPDPTGSDYVPGTDDGVADPVAQDVDTQNDNTGSGPDGEVNQVNIIPPNDQILNGPEGVPGASGPTDSNDDFTNESTTVPAGLEAGDPLPAAVTEEFTNTVNNPSTTDFLSNVTLQPISPTEAEGADGNATTGQYGVDADIPDGTIVTIEAPDPAGGGTLVANYEYNAGVFDLLNNTPGDTTTVDPAAEHVNVGDLLPSETLNYTVDITLPAGTEVLDEVGIPIIAFPDDNPDPASPDYGFTDETTNNITIDRLYTGFMDLVKSARVIAADGTTVETLGAPGADADGFLQDLTGLTIEPGEFIEYKIEYENISTPVAGAGNTTLSANNFVLLEEGGALDASGNTWGSTTDHTQNTVVTQGTVDYTDDATATTVTADPVDGTRVDEYRNAVGTVAPDGDGNPDGSLIFRREVL